VPFLAGLRAAWSETEMTEILAEEPKNYFNYFTEIEECYQKSRGTPSLLSPLDWALIESWKEAGVSLDAARVGIQRTFEKYSKRRRRFQKVNGLGYCVQEVLKAADELNAAVAQGGGATLQRRAAPPPPFSPAEIKGYLEANAVALTEASENCMASERPGLAQEFSEAAKALRDLVGSEAEKIDRLEPMEARLSALEEKLTAAMTAGSSVDLLTEIQLEVDRQLVPYRRGMNAQQIESLERQWRKRKLFEHYRVPRLSLFYL
jgi:hypothetical protein